MQPALVLNGCYADEQKHHVTQIYLARAHDCIDLHYIPSRHKRPVPPANAMKLLMQDVENEMTRSKLRLDKLANNLQLKQDQTSLIHHRQFSFSKFQPLQAQVLSPEGPP